MKSWAKQFQAAVWGMPLWTLEELERGYVFGCSLFCCPLLIERHCRFPLQNHYIAFRKHLQKAINEGTPSTAYRPVCVALEVLKTSKEDNPDDMDMDSNFGAGQEVEHAIKVLIGEAVANFVFAPRVTYGAIFYPDEARATHDGVIKRLEYSELERLACNFVENRSLISDASHHLISIMPHKKVNFTKIDNWAISFKSIQIAKKVVTEMRKEEDYRLRQMYDTFSRSPESSGMAGFVFEALAHRMIWEGSWLNREPQTSHMYSNREEPPSFSTAIPSFGIGTSLPPIPPLPLNGRRDTAIELARNLNDFTPDSGMYYIPNASNTPLFESFTITFNQLESTALISIFQMTISGVHHGSTKSYDVIRKIIRRVRELHSSFQIRVAYWLVCPSQDLQERSWEMPLGWSDNASINNHRGHVFCLRIPVEVCHLCSPQYLITNGGQ